MLNTVSFVDLESWIARVYQGKRVLIKPWFINTEYSLATNTEATNTVKVNSNADFVITDARAITTGTFVPPELKVQIVDNGSLERFFSDKVPLLSVFSNNTKNGAPGCWQNYRRVNGNSSLNITLDNRSANTLRVFLSLVGVLVYPYSGV